MSFLFVSCIVCICAKSRGNCDLRFSWCVAFDSAKCASNKIGRRRKRVWEEEGRKESLTTVWCIHCSLLNMVGRSACRVCVCVHDAIDRCASITKHGEYESSLFSLCIISSRRPRRRHLGWLLKKTLDLSTTAMATRLDSTRRSLLKDLRNRINRRKVSYLLERTISFFYYYCWLFW